MRSQFRFIFVICYFTAVLIVTVYLRSVENRAFYKLFTKPGFVLSVISLQISCAPISTIGASLADMLLASLITRGSAKMVWILLLAASTLPRQSRITPRRGL